MLSVGEPLHQLDHLWNMLCRARNHFRLFDVQRLRVFEECLGVELGVFLERLAGFEHSPDDLVFHVGYVHDVKHFIAEILQISAEHVHRYKRPEVSNVSVVVHRRATRIHPNGVALERFEFFERSRERVLKLQH